MAHVYGDLPSNKRDNYGYLKTNDGGIEGGLSAWHFEGDPSKDPGSTDILTADGKLGFWNEPRQDGDPDSRFGVRANGGLFKSSLNPGGYVSGDYGVGTAGVDLNAGSNGLSIGATANLIEGSMTAGNFTKGKNDEESLRLGLSAGGGAAGRLHWGDSDNDGSREYGFGFDIGPFSADLKTEDPVTSLIGALAGPMSW
jgi:hypothetical protein